MSDNSRFNRNLYHEPYELICESVWMRHDIVRIGGEAYPLWNGKGKVSEIEQFPPTVSHRLYAENHSRDHQRQRIYDNHVV